MKYALPVAVAVGLGISSAAQAVYLNSRGTGQVLVYPYYTVNANQTTMFTIVNTTAKGKALRLRFHEGYNGREVLDFNLYLSPFDIWSAEITQAETGADAPATLVNADNSCTVPAFTSVDFRSFAYTGANDDTGPQTPARTREGHFDVIEMGEVTNATHGTLNAITHTNSVPEDCRQLVAAWAAGGYWANDPTVDMAPPAGGLYGTESIIDVAQGTIYTINAEAIDGFSLTVLHQAPGTLTPDLNSANEGSETATVTATVPEGGKTLQATYNKPVDAISALFMANALYNEYDIDSSIGAQADWVVTFPTKRFYVDPMFNPAVDPSSNPPFDERFGASIDGQSCSPFVPQVFDREENTIAGGFCGVPPPVPSFGFCFETSVLTFNNEPSVLGSQLLGNASAIRTAGGFQSGHIIADLTSTFDGCTAQLDPAHALTASTNRYVLYGLPAFGFRAQNYINANVTPGVLANYSGLSPHRVSVSCQTNSDPRADCSSVSP